MPIKSVQDLIDALSKVRNKKMDAFMRAFDEDGNGGLCDIAGVNVDAGCTETDACIVEGIFQDEGKDESASEGDTFAPMYGAKYCAVPGCTKLVTKVGTICEHHCNVLSS